MSRNVTRRRFLSGAAALSTAAFLPSGATALNQDRCTTNGFGSGKDTAVQNLTGAKVAKVHRNTV